MGLPSGHRYRDYVNALKEHTFELNGRSLSPAELVKIKREQDEKWLKRDAEEGKIAPKDIPLYWDKLLRRKCRRVYYQKQVKEGQLKLELLYQPMENFITVDAADEWAEERNGYCAGVKTWQGESHWLICIHYKGEY